MDRILQDVDAGTGGSRPVMRRSVLNNGLYMGKGAPTPLWHLSGINSAVVHAPTMADFKATYCLTIGKIPETNSQLS